MNWFVDVLSFVGEEFLNVPAYLIGAITILGLWALKKNFGEIVGGAIKATMGFLILGAGANVVVASLDPLGELVLAMTGAQGVVPTNEVIVAIASEQYGTNAAYVLVLGFLMMIVLARFTPLKYIFLTGHHMVFMSTMIVFVFSLGFGAGHDLLTIILGGAVLATVLVVTPAFVTPFVKRITGNDSMTVGHFGSLGYIASGAVGVAVGKKSKSTEDLVLPQGLRFLRDSLVSTTLLMILIYLVFAAWGALALNLEEFVDIFGSETVLSAIMASLGMGLQFGIGVAIILYGVRLVLGELIPAFQGIAKKYVPGAKPALDIPVVFPFAKNAVLMGFISSFVAGLLSLFVIAVWFGPTWGLALILPGMVPHFFTGGGAGVFGNATGGRRGAILGGFVNGLLITLLPALLMKVLDVLAAMTGMEIIRGATFGDADFGVVGVFLGGSMLVGNTALSVILVLLFIFVMVGGAWVYQIKLTDRGWVPGAERARFFEEEK